MTGARPLRVLHLTGSPTSAHWAALSHTYARGCLDATADPDRWEPVVADVDPHGRWRIASSLAPEALAAAVPLAVGPALARLAELGADVVVPQMFCPAGLTTFRALPDLLGVPSVGNPASVMALTLDKARTRAVVAAAGVPVPEAEVVAPGGRATLAPPVVVKPVDGDNSVGVTLVRDRSGLDAALEEAWEGSRAALVERYVEAGREVRCGTVVHGGQLVALPPEEYPVDPVSAPVRTAADKLAPTGDGGVALVAKGAGRAWIVAGDDPVVPVAQAVATACHRALGCGHHGLVDLRIDPEGRPWFLESGPYCSFAPSSVVVTMAEAAGIGLPELFAGAVALALDGGSGRPLAPAANPTPAPAAPAAPDPS